MKKYSDSELAVIVKSKFAQGEFAGVVGGSVLVKVGKSYTRMNATEIDNASRILNRPVKEDLATVARDMVAAERSDNGVTLAESKTLTRSEVESNHRAEIAERYGI